MKLLVSVTVPLVEAAVMEWPPAFEIAPCSGRISAQSQPGVVCAFK
jgi:hypothetical protein